jgi:hypothetical protein
MNSKYVLFALLVTALTTGTSWVKLIGSATSGSSSGSSWGSHGGDYGGGSGYSGGGGGGGHK